MTSEEKLKICQNLRGYTATTLLTTLKKLKNSLPSEERLQTIWLEELQKNPAIFPDGWYGPPPHGIGVLMGGLGEESRLNYLSLRQEEFWPKKTQKWEKDEGLLYVYASPVDKNSGIIGDFGMTLYWGKNKILQAHLKKCLDLNKQIADFVDTGKTLAEIFNFAQKLLVENGLANRILSTTDPTNTNIGHTIPIINEDWTDEELQTLAEGETNWQKVCDMISKKRKFVNCIEKTIIQPGMAFTIEPRPVIINHPEIPLVSFHTIVIIHANGKKELVTNFEELFTFADMDYMLN